MENLKIRNWRIVLLKERASKARSSWKRGVITYAIELAEEIADSKKITEKMLLNGAADWKEYSYDGNALIYDADICLRLCTPSEIKRKRCGNLPPNNRENWLDVQARALVQAADLLLSIDKNTK